MITNLNSGHISGWSAHEDKLNGDYQWSAFGPWGTNMGRAATREEAETRARANLLGFNAVHKHRDALKKLSDA